MPGSFDKESFHCGQLEIHLDLLKMRHLMDLTRGREGTDDRRQLVSRSGDLRLLKIQTFEVSAGPLLADVNG